MHNKTYCINAKCPLEKCDKHLCQLKKDEYKDKYVKVATLDSVCCDYISYLINEIKLSLS